MVTARALRPTRLLAIAACVAVPAVLLATHSGVALTTGVLYLFPVALLAAVMLLGRYPGHRTLVALSGRRRTRRRRPPLAARTPRNVDVRCGGRLVTISLAGRAPPLAAGCS
ncbi:MAG TPA: hypothetical protein VMA83_00870 [Solirubrobacteraceae bacterium]|nr:hypothetical protein [Solirubrobacteraceae bacterium]